MTLYFGPEDFVYLEFFLGGESSRLLPSAVHLLSTAPKLPLDEGLIFLVGLFLMVQTPASISFSCFSVSFGASWTNSLSSFSKLESLSESGWIDRVGLVIFFFKK